MDNNIGMDQLAAKSASFIDRLLSGDAELTRENLMLARLASSSMSNFVRLLSVHHNQERTILRFAERLSGNPEEFAKYVTAALPDSGVTRMLGPGGGEKQS